MFPKAILLAALLFICVAPAWQQQDGVLTATTCETSTVKPAPEIKKYNFSTCIVAQFSSYVKIGQDKFVDLKNGAVNANASQCNNATSVKNPKLVVDFDCGQLELEMDHSNDSKVFVKAINGKYTIGNSSMTFANSSEQFVTTQSGHYYKCNSEQSVPVAQGVQLVLSNFAYEVYRTAKNNDFYQIPEECALDASHVSNWARIGVGICLVALVIIVLIAYFVGRRRWSERSSYESV